MFGDTGHGTIMLLFALFLILREKQLAAKTADDEVNYMLYDAVLMKFPLIRTLTVTVQERRRLHTIIMALCQSKVKPLVNFKSIISSLYNH